MEKKIILISLMGSILGLDRISVQVMVSRPIVSAPLVGLALGDLYTGLTVGAVLELFWIERLPIGTCVPPNDFLVSLLAASSSILVGQRMGHVSHEIITFAVLLFIPFGYLGQRLDSFIIKSNDTLSEGALRDAKHAACGDIGRKHLAGIGKVFLCYFLFLLISLLCGVSLMIRVFPLLPPACLTALAVTYVALPVLGVAAGLNTITVKGAIPVFCALMLVISIVMDLIK